MPSAYPFSSDFIDQYWQDSVFSDGTPLFVSHLQPAIGEKVSIRLRLLTGAPVSRIFLRYHRNGAHEISEMHPLSLPPDRRKTSSGPSITGLARVSTAGQSFSSCDSPDPQMQDRISPLTYYETEITMTEKKLRYQFYLLQGDRFYCYTQKGLTPFIQNETYDFCLLSDYVQPAWVKGAVFYQIFPERFCCGDPSLSVRDGEITYDGYASQQIRDWQSRPTRWEESHCLDFYGGDLEGIRQKIPYLKELGVTALYLNPIFRAPSVHKYDCVDYEAVDPHLGGDPALAALSEELHANGMRLILDISINHTGTEHKWFNRDCTFFPADTGAFHNPDSRERSYYLFGENDSYASWRNVSSLPQLNYRSRELREKLYLSEDSVLRKWLKPPYRIDGWRFDVADVMAKYDTLQLDHEVWQEIRESIRETSPQAYILAEDWTDCSAYLQGEEWDSPMNYHSCSRVLRAFLGVIDPVLDHTPGLPKTCFRLTGPQVREQIRSFLALLPFALQQNLFNLLDSHDVDRLHNHPEVDPEEYRGAVIAQFTLPGTPSVYYGDEAGIDGWIDSIEGCRFPMPWGSGFEAGETYRFYRRLAHLRQDHPVFSDGSFCFLYAEGQIFSFARFDSQECWITILSTETEDRWIDLPVGMLGICGTPGIYDTPGTHDTPEIHDTPSGKITDIFGRQLAAADSEPGILRLLIPAHAAFLFSLS